MQLSELLSTSWPKITPGRRFDLPGNIFRVLAENHCNSGDALSSMRPIYAPWPKIAPGEWVLIFSEHCASSPRKSFLEKDFEVSGTLLATILNSLGSIFWALAAK